MTPEQRLDLTVQLLAELREAADWLAASPTAGHPARCTATDRDMRFRYQCARRRLGWLRKAARWQTTLEATQRLQPCVSCGLTYWAHDEGPCESFVPPSR